MVVSGYNVLTSCQPVGRRTLLSASLTAARYQWFWRGTEMSPLPLAGLDRQIVGSKISLRAAASRPAPGVFAKRRYVVMLGLVIASFAGSAQARNSQDANRPPIV